MDGIDAILQSLPHFSALGTAGLVLFGILVAGFVAWKIYLWQNKKIPPSQSHADNQGIVAGKTDVENPALNDALESDQAEIDRLIE